MAISLAVEAAINAKWGGVDSTNHPAQTAGVAFIIVRICIFLKGSRLIASADFFCAVLQHKLWSSFLGLSKRDVRRKPVPRILDSSLATDFRCASVQLERPFVHVPTVRCLRILRVISESAFSRGQQRPHFASLTYRHGPAAVSYARISLVGSR
jgi:hypothetical protein